MLEIYGTLGPACHDAGILEQMLESGMTGIRINLSHGPLRKAEDWIDAWETAKTHSGKEADLLIDLQGRELRIGSLTPLLLQDGDFVRLQEEIPVEDVIYEQMKKGDILLLDDGKIKLQVLEKPLCAVLRGGILESRKGLKIEGRELNLPAVRQEDLDNLQAAREMGVTGVMIPFVQNAEDLREIRDVLQSMNLPLRIYAKIENAVGVQNIESFQNLCDCIVIARGDLANAVGMYHLPGVQLELEKRCRQIGLPYMVVTEMLDSMRHQSVCTRAEAMDVYRAVYSGAEGIMLTAETARGKFPLQAMQTFTHLAAEALKDREKHTPESEAE